MIEETTAKLTIPEETTAKLTIPEETAAKLTIPEETQQTITQPNTADLINHKCVIVFLYTGASGYQKYR